MRLILRIIVSLALCILGGCGGSAVVAIEDAPGDAGVGRTAAGTDDAGRADDRGTDGASTACGDVTCGAGQVCVTPCCGGPRPQCLPPDDAGGACPPGFHSAPCPGGALGCEADPCTPPPPYCESDPKKIPTGCVPTAPGASTYACVCA